MSAPHRDFGSFLSENADRLAKAIAVDWATDPSNFANNDTLKAAFIAYVKHDEAALSGDEMRKALTDIWLDAAATIFREANALLYLGHDGKILVEIYLSEHFSQARDDLFDEPPYLDVSLEDIEFNGTMAEAEEAAAKSIATIQAAIERRRLKSA